MPPKRMSCSPFSVVTWQEVLASSVSNTPAPTPNNASCATRNFDCNQFEIHEPLDGFEMRGPDIAQRNFSRANGFVKFPRTNRMAVEEAFDGLARCRVAGAATVRVEFETIKNRRIVAGRDHHAADGLQIFNGERNGRRGRRLRREHDLKIIPGKNFGGDSGETIR